jgi:hypothetical protein
MREYKLVDDDYNVYLMGYIQIRLSVDQQWVISDSRYITDEISYNDYSFRFVGNESSTNQQLLEDYLMANKLKYSRILIEIREAYYSVNIPTIFTTLKLYPDMLFLLSTGNVKILNGLLGNKEKLSDADVELSNIQIGYITGGDLRSIEHIITNITKIDFVLMMKTDYLCSEDLDWFYNKYDNKTSLYLKVIDNFYRKLPKNTYWNYELDIQFIE